MKKLLFFLACIVTTLSATERAPWFPRYLEFQPRLTYCFQKYQRVDVGDGTKRHSSSNNFVALSVSGAYDRYAVELETSAASTRHRSFSVSDFAVTGRYQILNDTIGDPLSLTTGVTVTQVLTLARHDISCFYHGGIEAELHLAAGQEISSEQFWDSRYWGVFGFGCADLGSPWLRGNLNWETNCWDCQKLRVYVDSLWGCGHDKLHIHHFRGYGPIRHQSVDLGLVYTYCFECGLFMDLGYAYRVYARNCPSEVNQVLISLLYPFGP